MSELTIPVDLENPVAFFGINDSNLDLLREKFPAFKLIVRGNELKILGDEKQIHWVAKKITGIIEYFHHYGKFDNNVLEKLITNEQNAETLVNPPTGNGSDVLVFGPNGVVVKARTANQQKMVDSCNKNDIVFAIGPAGTGKTYTAVALAVRALKNKEIKRIVLTRPAVEAGENLGFFTR